MMTRLTSRLPLARLAAAAHAAVALLTACGGGNLDSGPLIYEFGADRAAYFVGDRAQLRIRYSGGSGRIEPDVGAVGADAVNTTGALERSLQLRLVVEAAGRTVTRELALAVGYRDRHRPLGQLQIAEHSAAALDDGTVLLIGGSRAELNVLSPWIERVDPIAGAVTRVGELATGRSQGVITRLADGRLLISGGTQAEHLAGRMNEIVTIDRSGAVSVAGTGDMTHRRTGHTATLLADGRVLVVGGNTVGEGAPGGISRSAEIWDPATGRFRLLAGTMISAREGHTATRLPDGKVLVVGGYSVDVAPILAEIFDPAAEAFAAVPAPGLASRAGHAAVPLPGGDVLILGGETPAGTTTLASVLRFRHTTATFDPMQDLLEPRRHAAAVAAADGMVLLFGGIGSEERALASVEGYSPALGARPIATMAQARFGHSATLLRGLSAGKVLVVGGWLDRWYNPTLSMYE